MVGIGPSASLRANLVSRAAPGFILSRRSWVQLQLVRARPMAEMASTGRGRRVVYHKEALILVSAMHITASEFVNDHESGLHHDYEVGLEALAPALWADWTPRMSRFATI